MKGLRHGEGIFKWKDGSKYTGKYKEGKNIEMESMKKLMKTFLKDFLKMMFFKATEFTNI